jgi:predicted RNase H-like nuclease (RuvC/YqgF family)
MGKEKQNIYWIKTGETFAGKGVGADITDYLDIDNDGEVIEGSRLDGLMADGKVSFEEPASHEAAEEKELNQLRATIQEQKEKISELENEIKTTPKNVKEANKKIKSLEKQIDELTKPGGGKK